MSRDEFLQLLRKSYGRVVEVGDDGWECTCMLCGREGQLLMCEHGMQASDTIAQCPKVAHAKCMGIAAPPDVFICPLHSDSCCGPDVREKLEAKTRALDDSSSIPQSQVSNSVPQLQVMLLIRSFCETRAWT
jgi:hypothetical protein